MDWTERVHLEWYYRKALYMAQPPKVAPRVTGMCSRSMLTLGLLPTFIPFLPFTMEVLQVAVCFCAAIPCMERALQAAIREVPAIRAVARCSNLTPMEQVLQMFTVSRPTLLAQMSMERIRMGG